ncbi:MAG: hypothetical protein EBY81_03990 [Verrucomicrobia bacterium]|nr:hypothetical protein [Verrucomicrobiota bacterium]
MPAKSQAQFRYMAAVASGKIKKPGLSAKEARKFIHESKGTYGKLPAMAMNPDNPDKGVEGSAKERMSDSPSTRKAEYGNKFGKNTYAGKKKPAKGKKMSRADFLKMVREKKFAKKKK